MLNKILSFIIVVGIPGVISFFCKQCFGLELRHYGSHLAFRNDFLRSKFHKGKKMESRPLGRTRNGACGF